MGRDVNSWLIVPPKQKSWTTTGFCMHQCTEVKLKIKLLLFLGQLVLVKDMECDPLGRTISTEQAVDLAACVMIFL